MKRSYKIPAAYLLTVLGQVNKKYLTILLYTYTQRAAWATRNRHELDDPAVRRRHCGGGGRGVRQEVVQELPAHRGGRRDAEARRDAARQR